MREAAFLSDRRGVSTALGYVIALSISAILISGLLIAGGTLVENERESVARDQLAVAAEQLASGVMDADRLAASADGGTVRVRVWLPERAGSAPYAVQIVPQSTPPGQPYAATLVAKSEVLDISVNLTVRSSFELAARTVEGGPVVITHTETDGDGERELSIQPEHSAPPVDPDPVVTPRDEVVFVDADTAELSTVAPDGTVTRYGVDAKAIGPKEVDFDGDGLQEIPFVTSANELKLVDETGEVQTLTSDASYSPQQNTYGTLVAVGTWRGETSVFYTNITDVGPNDEATIYRVGLDGKPTKVTVGGSEVEANAIAGVADVNDDGDSDLVFLGNSQRIRYLDDNAEVDTGQGVGANFGLGVGAPRVIQSGEVARTPFVASNNVKLLRYVGGSGTVTDLTTGGSAESTFVAAIDWVGDDKLEVVYVDGGAHTLTYVTVGGSTTTILDSSGNPIEVDRQVGTA